MPPCARFAASGCWFGRGYYPLSGFGAFRTRSRTRGPGSRSRSPRPPNRTVSSIALPGPAPVSAAPGRRSSAGTAPRYRQAGQQRGFAADDHPAHLRVGQVPPALTATAPTRTKRRCIIPACSRAGTGCTSANAATRRGAGMDPLRSDRHRSDVCPAVRRRPLHRLRRPRRARVRVAHLRTTVGTAPASHRARPHLGRSTLRHVRRRDGTPRSAVKASEHDRLPGDVRYAAVMRPRPHLPRTGILGIGQDSVLHRRRGLRRRQESQAAGLGHARAS